MFGRVAASLGTELESSGRMRGHGSGDPCRVSAFAGDWIWFSGVGEVRRVYCGDGKNTGDVADGVFFEVACGEAARSS